MRPASRPAPAPAPAHTPDATAAPATATATAPAGAPAASAAPALIPAHPVAGLAGNERPAYPPAALRRREAGEVVVRVAIGADGRPLSASIERSSGHPLLDDAALAKVLRDWRFAPAMRGGVAVAGSALVPFSFQIGD